MPARSPPRGSTTARRWWRAIRPSANCWNRPAARKPTTWPGAKQRLRELQDRPSRLDPLWYAGSFAIGVAAGLANDRVSLGFVAETERQVERHLDAHLEQLPATDLRSRAILTQMRADEIAHGELARRAGGRIACHARFRSSCRPPPAS